MISYIKVSLFVCSKTFFLNVKSQQLYWKILRQFKCKCNQRKVILNGIEFRVSKMIYKDIWGFVCPSVSLSILRSAIVAKAFSSDIKTHKSHIFPMVALRGVAKLSISPKVTIFPPLVPYYLISDQCLKGDRWTTLFWGKSIVAMDL